MAEYTYVGDGTVEIEGLGVVSPGDTVESFDALSRPDFALTVPNAKPTPPVTTPVAQPTPDAKSAPSPAPASVAAAPAPSEGK